MWNQVCGKIFSDYTDELKNRNIRYFVLRNYENLPEQNIGKDVDVIVDPKRKKDAVSILKSVYRKNGLHYYDEAVFDQMTCTHGMGLKNKTGIHIDVIGGYLSRGYELYTFDELYRHVAEYKGFCVLGELMDGVMLLVYKLFGYRKPKLKEKYREKIYEIYTKYPKEYQEELERLTDSAFAEIIVESIQKKDFDNIIACNQEFSKKLVRHAHRKARIKTLGRRIRFLWQKTDRTIFRYRKFKRVFAVLAPDGTGKTTFLDELIEQLNRYYVSDPEDGKFHVYHFRPTVLPNLGAVGEKAGVMEQDKDFTNPHRSKPANPISSFVRMGYYMMDYIIGWQKCVRNDVRCDRYSVFDRYSYDFIVDPLRSKIGLPMAIRKMFVALTPKPPIVFVLNADATTIFERKQELTKEEIERQLTVYRKLAKSGKRFYVINAERTPEEMAEEALEIIFKKYCS
jgi:thymidylate kinase